MAQRGVNEAKLEIYGDLQRPEEGRAGAAGRLPEAGMRTAVRIGGGAAGTGDPDRPPAGTGTGAKKERGRNGDSEHCIGGAADSAECGGI